MNIVCPIIVMQWVLAGLFYIWTIGRRHSRNLITPVILVVALCTVFFVGFEMGELDLERKRKDREEKLPIYQSTLLLSIVSLIIIGYSYGFGRLGEEHRGVTLAQTSTPHIFKRVKRQAHT